MTYISTSLSVIKKVLVTTKQVYVTSPVANSSVVLYLYGPVCTAYHSWPKPMPRDILTQVMNWCHLYISL